MNKKGYLRETKYAGLIAEGILKFSSTNELRVERLYVKERGTLEIRFSWWKNGGLMMRPLDATEPELLSLFKKGIKNRVFTQAFCNQLRALL